MPRRRVSWLSTVTWMGGGEEAARGLWREGLEELDCRLHTLLELASISHLLGLGEGCISFGTSA
jgi:hypothetical protein